MYLTRNLSARQSTRSVDRDPLLPRRYHRRNCLVDARPLFRSQGPKNFAQDHLLAQSALCAIVRRLHVRFRSLPLLVALLDLMGFAVQLTLGLSFTYVREVTVQRVINAIYRSDERRMCVSIEENVHSEENY